ncbi:MAG TPA: nitroreductase family protein [Gaiellales bacterium]
MDVFTALCTARAVRRFEPRPLTGEEIARILAAARLSPSSKNDQRWSFIVCTDREHLQQLSKIGDYAGHLSGAAAAVAVIVPKSDAGWERELFAFDTGQCVRNMMLAAWELGIGSCHASVYDPLLTRELLGFPDDMRCDLLVSFGHPADPSLLTHPIPESARRPLDEMVHRERW